MDHSVEFEDEVTGDKGFLAVGNLECGDELSAFHILLTDFLPSV